MSQKQEKKTTSKVDMQMPEPEDESGTQDLTQFVQNLLEQMHSRFQQMSNSIIGRLDEMGTRLDELERSIGELMTQAGIEEDIQQNEQSKD